MNFPNRENVLLERFFLCALASTIAWLVISVGLVNIEFDDGYTTIANTRYFLGESTDYFWQRGPLLAWILIPGEWISDLLGSHPLNVRSHHAIMTILHAATLWAGWWRLRAEFGDQPGTRIAWIAAMLTPVFFSYAPFISHDIFPGLLLLLQLTMADRFVRAPSARLWLGLATIGTLAPLVKHTYAVIWVAVLLATISVSIYERQLFREWRRLLAMALAAATSGAVTWGTYAVVLASTYPNAEWWSRPILQAQAFVVAFQREGQIGDIIYQWVYLKNWHAYGALAMLLVVPGLILSWRQGNRLQRTAVITWLILIVTMALIQFKEVRYLAYLAPITAILLVPILTRFWERRGALLGCCVLLLSWDLAASTREAVRLTSSFYRTSVTQFLAPLPINQAPVAPIILTKMLSFVSPEDYAFFGDRYHRVTHLNSEQLRALYGYPLGSVVTIADRWSLSGADFSPGATLVFVNDVAARVPPIPPDNRVTLAPDFMQLLGVAEQIELHHNAGAYALAAPSRQPIMLLHAPGRTHAPLASHLSFPADAVLDSLAINGQPATVSTIGFRVYSLCTVKGCQSF